MSFPFRGGPPPQRGGPGPFRPPPFGGPLQRPLQPPSPWMTHTTAEGKTYYYNSSTKKTSWEKPEELKTPLERALAATPWKEYVSTDQAQKGKKYYYNTETKKTTWEMPPEYKAILDSVSQGFFPAPGPPMGGGGRDDAPRAGEIHFETKEEAVEAFWKLLEQTGVLPTWTWSETMRLIISHPSYGALKTLSERRDAFQRFVDTKAKKEMEEREAKLVIQREAFRNLLAAREDITADTRFRIRQFSVDPHDCEASFVLTPTLNRACADLLGEEPAFVELAEPEREKVFAEHMQKLRAKQLEEVRETRKANISAFETILKSLTESGAITVKTRWKEAPAIYTSHPSYTSHPTLSSMEMTDHLLCWERHIRRLFEAAIRDHEAELTARRRREMNAQAAFRQLLEELHLTRASTWKSIYPGIKDDPRYRAALRFFGSSPLTMFWDALMLAEDRFQNERRGVLDAVKASGVTIEPDTVFENFLTLLDDEMKATVDPNSLRIVFEELIEKANQKAADDKRRAERRLRRKMDAFKSLLKRVDPKIVVDTEWETVRLKIENKTDFMALEEAQRVEVFEKFIARLKEKDQEKDVPSDKSDEDEDGSIAGEGDSRKRKSSKRDRGDRYRDRRDRDRKRHRRHRSRSGSEDEDERERRRQKRKRSNRSDDERSSEGEEGGRVYAKKGRENKGPGTASEGEEGEV
ncbi:hypothetical protein BDK51DRAFT_26318 [Blyttiomyces helicus]|uniref:FF domain-containing protein n=1 Tax=Blyttiomyces helicus TaxID=388810 RepID=A0A4P9WB88_9FUNG|nr:hypothetical protein BDK51DRAFT_26318 [Blyttiomyces helicus]|eukprot:RKO89879.1 hypothetical protein BDK51DRAFT_26318 [Blyttiomyces helicus]